MTEFPVEDTADPLRLCAECGAYHRSDNDNSCCERFTPVVEPVKGWREVAAIITRQREEIAALDAVLNEQAAVLVANLAGQNAQIDLTVGLQRQVKERDRVIARLLDGWQPGSNGAPLTWFKFGGSSREDRREPMSDGEAAIIRQHQEKT